MNFGDKERYLLEGINYRVLTDSNIIDENGLPTDNLLLDDIPVEFKRKIDGMKVEKPDNDEYKSNNALKFGCAKIVLLTCVHCVMLDIHKALTNTKKMPARFDDKLTIVGDINASLFEENEDCVYVDNKPKQWWSEKNPRKVHVLDDCEKSVKRFLTNIIGNFDLLILWGLWVYRIGKTFRS